MPTEAFPEAFGFRAGPVGTHTSRTIMLDELSSLLAAAAVDTTRDTFFALIVDGNLLGKGTEATRKLTARRLTELYALTPSVSLFRVLRQFWERDHEGRPLLAMLCALARDPLLRATAQSVLSLKVGDELLRQFMTGALRAEAGDRLNDAVLGKVVRNASSSWTQSGHLTGRVRKMRTQVRASAYTTAYAVLLGFLQGLRGARLFSTLWVRVLDLPKTELLPQLHAAKRLGLIDYKDSGDVVSISFERILTARELQEAYVST